MNALKALFSIFRPSLPASMRHSLERCARWKQEDAIAQRIRTDVERLAEIEAEILRLAEFMTDPTVFRIFPDPRAWADIVKLCAARRQLKAKIDRHLQLACSR